MKLVIGEVNGKPIGFDLETLVRTRLLIQADSGGGKSWLIRVLLEQAFGKIQTIVIDPEGEFSTLREKFPFVLVGKGGETPSDPRSAELVAHRLLERVSRNLNTSEQKILATIHNHYPAEIDKQRLADITGYAADGGGFNNYLGHLRTLGLIEGKGAVKCSEYLFVE